MNLLFWLGLIVLTGIMLVGIPWYIRSEQLKRLDRSNGAFPKFYGERNWPTVPHTILVNAKREVLRGPAYITGWSIFFVAVLAFNLTTDAAGLRDQASFPIRIVIYAVLGAILMFVFQTILGAMVRKRLQRT